MYRRGCVLDGESTGGRQAVTAVGVRAGKRRSYARGKHAVWLRVGVVERFGEQCPVVACPGGLAGSVGADDDQQSRRGRCVGHRPRASGLRSVRVMGPCGGSSMMYCLHSDT